MNDLGLGPNPTGLWDSAAGEFNWFDTYRQPINLATVAAVAANLSAHFPPGAEFVPGNTNVTQWVYESHTIAANVGYEGISPNTTASATYVSTVRTTCNARIVLGGWRLAEVLNNILPHIELAPPSAPPDDGRPRFPTFVVGIAVVVVVVAVAFAARVFFKAKRRQGGAGDYQGSLIQSDGLELAARGDDAAAPAASGGVMAGGATAL